MFSDWGAEESRKESRRGSNRAKESRIKEKYLITDYEQIQR